MFWLFLYLGPLSLGVWIAWLFPWGFLTGLISGLILSALAIFQIMSGTKDDIKSQAKILNLLGVPVGTLEKIAGEMKKHQKQN